jgi:hypothetical protein
VVFLIHGVGDADADEGAEDLGEAVAFAVEVEAAEEGEFLVGADLLEGQFVDSAVFEAVAGVHHFAEELEGAGFAGLSEFL